MKKSLLSVLAAGLVVTAVAPVALANGELGANRKTEEHGYYADTTKPASVAEIKAENDKDLGNNSEKWTRDANKLKKGETLKVDKGQADKAAANKMAGKSGVRALPKTSAAK